MNNDKVTLRWQAEEEIDGLVLTGDFDVSQASEGGGVSATFAWLRRGRGMSSDTLSEALPASCGIVAIDHRFRSGLQLKGTVRLLKINKSSDDLAVWGDLRFGSEDREMRFEGAMALVPGAGEPVPPEPPSPPSPPAGPIVLPSPMPGPHPPLPAKDGGASLSPPFVVDSERGALFPYVFLRRWFDLCTPSNGLPFVTYVPVDPPVENFYSALVASAANRSKMEAVVAQFFETGVCGVSKYVPQRSGLYASLRPYPALFERAESTPISDWSDFETAAILALGLTPAEIVAELSAASYREGVEDAWQSWFALALEPGCQTKWAVQLEQVLLVERLLDLAFVAPCSSRGDFHASLKANVVLPSEFFPPSSESAPSDSDRDLGPKSTEEFGPVVTDSVEPFALGDLLKVRHELLRYLLRDVAAVECVMGGEQKEATRRRLRRTVRKSSETDEEANAEEEERASGQEDLRREVLRAIEDDSRTVTYKNFSSNYGPPAVVKLNGSWTSERKPVGSPARNDRNQYARSLIDRAVTRTNDRVRRARSFSVTEESEDRERRVIDNRNARDPLIGIYRWASKLYRLEVVNYGVRLVARFALHDPGRGIRDRERAESGVDLSPPDLPRDLGVLSFEDVNSKNYAKLYRSFGVGEGPLPPEARVSTALVVVGTTAEIVIPKGYVASKANVMAVGPTGTVEGLVGGQKFSVAAGSGTSLTLEELDGSVPIFVSGPAPSDTPPAVAPQTAVSVQVTSTPSAKFVGDWQTRAYAAINAAARKSLRARNRAVERMLEGRDGVDLQRLLVEELRLRCVEILLAMDAGTVSFPPETDPVEDRTQKPPHGGEDSEVSPEATASAGVSIRSRDASVVDGLFEWSEMSHDISGHTGSPTSWSGIVGEDDRAARDFLAFVVAGDAEVLVPLRAESSITALYYLRTGTLWQGPETFAPVVSGDESIAAELKTGRAGECRREGDPWEVDLPTSMSVLTKDTDLCSIDFPHGVKPDKH